MTLIKHLARVIAGQSPAGDDVTDLEGGRAFLQGKAEFGSHSPEPRYECAIAPKVAPTGSVLVSVRAPVGAVNMADRAYGIGRGLAAIVPVRASAFYIRYLMEARAPYLRSLATGSTFEAIAAADIGGITVPVEPLAEQQAIADYLDRETAKIDTLIEKQRTMIERLRERRTEVVLHAVSKGIDENVPMRHIDIPWIQEMPTHWRATALRQVARFTGGSGFPVHEQGLEDEAIPFYKVNALARSDGDGVVRATYDTVSHETAARLGVAIVPAGTLVIAKIGAALLLGRIRMLAHDSCIDNNMLAISPRPKLDPRFAFHALCAVRMDLLVNPGAVPSLSEKWFRAYQIPIPPLEEQREIADYLDRETAKIDTLIAKVERHIELAKERRAALITAAVTGQLEIDGTVAA